MRLGSDFESRLHRMWGKGFAEFRVGVKSSSSRQHTLSLSRSRLQLKAGWSTVLQWEYCEHMTVCIDHWAKSQARRPFVSEVWPVGLAEAIARALRCKVSRMCRRATLSSCQPPPLRPTPPLSGCLVWQVLISLDQLAAADAKNAIRCTTDGIEERDLLVMTLRYLVAKDCEQRSSS